MLIVSFFFFSFIFQYNLHLIELFWIATLDKEKRNREKTTKINVFIYHLCTQIDYFQFMIYCTLIYCARTENAKAIVRLFRVLYFFPSFNDPLNWHTPLYGCFMCIQTIHSHLYIRMWCCANSKMVNRIKMHQNIDKTGRLYLSMPGRYLQWQL